MEERLELLIGLLIVSLFFLIFSIFIYIETKQWIWLFSLILWTFALLWLIRLIIIIKLEVKSDNYKIPIIEESNWN